MALWTSVLNASCCSSGTLNRLTTITGRRLRRPLLGAVGGCDWSQSQGKHGSGPAFVTTREGTAPHPPPLTGDDAGEHQGYAEGLGPAEELSGEEHAEHCADDRVDQTDERDGSGRHPDQTAEPAVVGNGGAHRRQPQQPAE